MKGVEPDGRLSETSPSKEEFIDAIMKAKKNGKAPRNDKITSEVLKSDVAEV